MDLEFALQTANQGCQACLTAEDSRWLQNEFN